MSYPAPVYENRSPLAHSLARIYAMVLRFWYLLKGSGPRIIDLIYWPAVQVTLWGFIQSFLMEQSTYFAQAFGILLGAVLLWDILFRGQIGLNVAFLEEVWSRNLGHLLVSPLRPGELIISFMAISLIKTLAGVIPASLLALWFFGFSVYSLGLGLIAFFLILICFGWAIGLIISGIILRYGLGAESLVWAVVFAIAPLSGVYYPVSILPDWAQTISAILPPAYIFEGMRAILIEQTLRVDLIVTAGLINLIYLIAGIVLFHVFLTKAKERGMILQIGE